LSDIEAMTAQEEIFGPGGGASDTTMLRVLDELSGRLRADGLPGRRLARATAAARAKAWAAVVDRHGQLPAVTVAGTDLTRPAVTAGESPRPVLVVRLDATLLDAASSKDRAAGTYKQGYGFHPLTAWATNIGDHLAVMLRPGNAGSFTASDHIAVLDAALAQLPAPWRGDVLVTIDGAGASHEVIDHLTALNTAARHGRRGRRVEYSIGWPVDERTLGAIAALREGDWGDALDTDGVADPGAGVAELTGIRDGVRAGDHAQHHREQLGRRVGGGHREPLQQTGQPRPARQRRHRHQPDARHEVRIVEPGGDLPTSVRESHPADTLLSGTDVTFASHILPAQRGIRASRPAFTSNYSGASRLRRSPVRIPAADRKIFWRVGPGRERATA